MKIFIFIINIQKLQILKRVFLYVFVLIAVSGFSQSPEDEIDPENINTAYLEHLVKKKVDSVRLSKGLTELVNDSILYVASLHHSSAMAKAGALNHYEILSKYKTPQKRVEAFGAVNYFAGENVAYITAYKKYYLKQPELNEYFTYGEFATKMVRNWVKSRGHYRNIIKKEYQVTGVSSHYDKKTKRIYVTQKFAEVKSKFVFIENTRFFPYEEDNEITYDLKELKQVARRMHRGPHRWHLKPRKKFRRCKECDAVTTQNHSFNFYVDTSNNIHFVTENGSLFKRLTRRPGDGFALETVHYKDYECSSTNFFLVPSRRNGQCIANGIIQKPVYKWKLRKQYRRVKLLWNLAKWKKIRKILFRFQFSHYGEAFSDMGLMFPGCPSDNIVGKLPVNDSDYYECNVLFLKKKRVCSLIQFTDYCGKYFNTFKPTPLLPELSNLEYRYPEDTLNYNFTVHFKQGKSTYNYEEIKPLLDTLKLQNYSIVRLHINATASIEGDEKINNKLTLNRSLSIQHALDSTVLDTATNHILAEEAWDHFYKKVAATPYAYLGKLKKEEIKKELLKPELVKELEPILEQERKAEIKLWLMQKVIDSIRVQHAVKRYKELIDSASGSHPSPRIASKLLIIQSLLYKRVQEGKLPVSKLIETIPPGDGLYSRVHFNYVVFKRMMDTLPSDENSDRSLYQALFKVALKRGASQVERFNFLSLLINHWDSAGYYDKDEKVQPKKIFALLGRLNNSAIPKDTLERLKLNFYFKAANWFSFIDPDDNLQLRAMNNIYYHYRSRTYTDSSAYKLAQYFIFYGRDNYAYRMLAPFALMKNPDHEVFALYLKIAYAKDMYHKRSRLYKLLKTAPTILTKQEYCDLFTGPCNISMQVFENEEIRTTWCKTCSDYKNFAVKYREREKTEKEK